MGQKGNLTWVFYPPLPPRPTPQHKPGERPKTLVQNSNNIYYLPSETTTGDEYYLLNKVLCYQGGVLQGQAEKVNINKIELLNKSLLTSPSSQYPAYTQKGDSITIYPTTFNGALASPF